MKKLLFILIFLPTIGIASFPIIADSEEHARTTTVPLEYDVNQKIDHKEYITNILLEKDDPWTYVRWTLVIVASILIIMFFLGILALAMYNPGGKSLFD